MFRRFFLQHPVPVLLAAALGLVGGRFDSARAAPDTNAKAAETPYIAQALEVMAHIQKNFRDRRTGFYFEDTAEKKPAFVWPAGVLFSAFTGGARHDPASRQAMSRYFDALDAYWDKKAKVPGYEPSPTGGGGNDKYYDDNAWLVLAFLEAHEVTGDAKYLRRARDTLKFVISGWDDSAGGGIWWHEGHKDDGKNTCANAPAALGCYRMSKFDVKRAADWIREGARIVDWTEKTLGSPNGLYFDHIKVSGKEIGTAVLTYNAGLMLRAYLAREACSGDPRALEEAKRVGAAAAELFDPATGAYRDALKWSHLMVEADLALHRRTGDAAVLARAKADAAYHLAEWRKSPPTDLITNAALAREPWLLADAETKTGREFWEKSDRPKR